MADPHDPNSIPMLTDVIVPGRPPIARPGTTQHETACAETLSAERQGVAPGGPAAAPSGSGATHATAAGPMQHPGTAAPYSTASSAAAFDARDIEFIAERLRSRFSTYMRQDARGMIEARCRDAVEEHTNWLVRQVTREVVNALEQEVAGWVRDAVSEELARHTSRR
ncbi:MAG: DUF2486 family protein [Trinickia sp.]|jgi:hypothetical protein